LHSILILKTGALGDVLRTTSILPGLRHVHPAARIEWLTAPAARELVEGHALVERVHLLDVQAPGAVEAAAAALGARSWDWVISLDDEAPLCALAGGLRARKLTGAHLDVQGRPTYSPDAAPWFDMGLLSRLGKPAADRLKLENERGQAEIYAAMLGLPPGRPALAIPGPAGERAASLYASCPGLPRPRVGLNTGAGGRWTSKQLPVERVVAFVRGLHDALGGEVGFVLLGGPEEGSRNERLRAGIEGLSPRPTLLDAGVDNSLLEFAAIVAGLDLLLTSDSLALHIAIARRVPVVAFFAPTSAAEIELHGPGEKVRSESPDYCSYRPDADTTTLTAERLVAASRRVLAAVPAGGPPSAPSSGARP
jgi:heptosyltransferase-2